MNKMTDNKVINDNHLDDHVDEEIKQCFSVDNPRNFFMFAGAGSGKTRSLINTLAFLDKTMGKNLSTHAKQIAVITYTNAACDEIIRRLQYNPLFLVSTIHSFLWELIKSHQVDIKAWVKKTITEDIAELEDKQRKGRDGKASNDRAADIKRKIERLAKIDIVRRFSYNPNGENVGYDSLNHSEVIKMGSEFIATEDTMQEILTAKYPILLIDESQDTKKELVDALFLVCEKHKGMFIVGMFGDTMQKIYTDGKENLASCIPDSWMQPAKVMNHRSAERIVKLANIVRSKIDEQCQWHRSDAEAGVIRLFIAPSSSDKTDIERQAAEIMAKEANDDSWLDEFGYKSLILEHHMAANRFGFSNIYEPLNDVDGFDTSLRDGTIPELSLLANVVSPLVHAYHDNNDFEVSKIVRKHSPLLDKKTFVTKTNQVELLQDAEKAVEDLLSLWKNGAVPSCIEIARSIQKTRLFKLHSRFDSILGDTDENPSDAKAAALKVVLAASFDELERYSAYVTNQTRFATHQGIKGLEFPNVMVIMDDAGSRGFLFSYEKLFGAKAKTDTDIMNEHEGKDTSILRTTRLFYVACTRAKKSLAVIAYTDNVTAVQATAISNGWFTEDEIRHIEPLPTCLDE